MNLDKLLELCYLSQFPQVVTEETNSRYAEALQLGYVYIDRPKRARSDKFFLTDKGLEAVRPVMYRHTYDRLYMYRDAPFTIVQLEDYHKTYPDMDGYDLMIRYYKDRISEYDGNRTKRPPRTYIYFIAELYRQKGDMLEALRHNLLLCILDLSGIMEVPTQEQVKGLESSYAPGGIFYKDQKQLLERCQLAPAIISGVTDGMEKLDYNMDQLKELYTDTYQRLHLPVSIRTEAEIFQIIADRINEDKPTPTL